MDIGSAGGQVLSFGIENKQKAVEEYLAEIEDAISQSSQASEGGSNDRRLPGSRVVSGVTVQT